MSARQPVRICPVCSAADRIVDNERLWPPDWCCPTCGHALVIRTEFPSLAPELDGADVGFDPTVFTTLARIEGEHFWFQVRNELIAWLVRRYGASAKRILEIGCGTGFVLDAIRAACPGASIAGSELHSVGLSLARRRHGAAVELIQGDARRLCLRDAVDLICALDVLEHIEEDEAVLGGIWAGLRSGGILIASVPQHPWLWSKSDDLSRHVRRYRVGEIERKVRTAGFDLRFSDSFVSLLLPALAVSRLMGRIGPGRFRRERPLEAPSDPVAREFRVGPVLNRAMLVVLQMEHLSRRAGLRSPAGGTRVIVGQKRA
jgi:SAM-dependent methyltransferase